MIDPKLYLQLSETIAKMSALPYQAQISMQEIMITHLRNEIAGLKKLNEALEEHVTFLTNRLAVKGD